MNYDSSNNQKFNFACHRIKTLSFDDGKIWARYKKISFIRRDRPRFELGRLLFNTSTWSHHRSARLRSMFSLNQLSTFRASRGVNGCFLQPRMTVLGPIQHPETSTHMNRNTDTVWVKEKYEFFIRRRRTCGSPNTELGKTFFGQTLRLSNVLVCQTGRAERKCGPVNLQSPGPVGIRYLSPPSSDVADHRSVLLAAIDTDFQKLEGAKWTTKDACKQISTNGIEQRTGFVSS
ncbi:hypothetical protein CBL_10419 [Carabus blaptoides fortunei]